MADDVRALVGWLVAEGVQSVHTHETRPERIRGCLAGFELVRALPPTLEAYEAVLAERHYEERRLAFFETVDDTVYWEYRCATAQIEHVYERLKVVYGAPVVSARAALQVAEYAALRESGYG